MDPFLLSMSLAILLFLIVDYFDCYFIFNPSPQLFVTPDSHDSVKKTNPKFLI